MDKKNGEAYSTEEGLYLGNKEVQIFRTHKTDSLEYTIQRECVRVLCCVLLDWNRVNNTLYC